MVQKDWFVAKQILRIAKTSIRVMNQEEWLPPPQGFFKCNANASLNDREPCTRWGTVIRDEKEAFVIGNVEWSTRSCRIISLKMSYVIFELDLRWW